MSEVFQKALTEALDKKDAFGFIQLVLRSAGRRFSEKLNEQYTPAPYDPPTETVQPLQRTGEDIGDAANLEENPERKLVMELTAMARQSSAEDDVHYNAGVFVCTIRKAQGVKDFLAWCDTKPSIAGYTVAVMADDSMEGFEQHVPVSKLDSAGELDFVVTVFTHASVVQYPSVALGESWDDRYGDEQFNIENGVLVEARKRTAAVRKPAPSVKCKPGYTWDASKKACVCVDDDSMQESMNNRTLEILQEGYEIFEAKTGKHGETIDHKHPDSIISISGITKDFGGGYQARTRDGSRYKLSVKATGHRMPSPGEVLETAKHKKFTNAEQLKTDEYKNFS